LLGVFVILYAVYSLLVRNESHTVSSLWAVPAGGLGGLVGTLFGTGGPFYVVYLKHRGLPKTQFRATFAMIFLVDGAGRLTGYLVGGYFDRDWLILAAMALNGNSGNSCRHCISARSFSPWLADAT